MREALNNIMRAIAENLQYPVIVVLLVLTALTVVLIGTIIVEAFTEHRQLQAVMPELVDDIRGGAASLRGCIQESQILKSQKAILLELTQHPDLTNDMREALAVRMVEQESAHYERRVMVTDVMAKLGPIFGLLGTLIPLGPGIIALGQGNTYLLSQSLLTAFDTTILGLIAAAACMIISTIRKHWYRNYMSVLETLTECVLEREQIEDEQTA